MSKIEVRCVQKLGVAMDGVQRIDSQLILKYIFLMKYKHIPSFLHNFTDSFMSLVNYSGDGYVVDALDDFLRNNDCGRLDVRWLPELQVGHMEVPEKLGSAFSSYAHWIPALADSMGVEVAKIVDMRTVFSVDGSRVRADTLGVDDRGKTVFVPPKFWL
jgi:hypothetical protein